ncbi:MAG: SDR family oxidoreductase [Raineya sp.]|nr:SDR family oxidoreductase [Raineya sp.]MDW8295434.1 SDR family oxidoreductase [Raineya sp.]
MENKIALITGATSGIGEATARLFAQKGLKIIICGRRKERLERLQAELSQLTSVHTLCFDVSKYHEVTESLTTLPQEWKDIDVLVNNAGNAHGLEPIHTGKLSDWEAMIDINVKGLLYVSQCIIPQMVERKTGHIINIGSIAGKETYPNGNVYCASKAAVDSLTKGMRMDLNPFGIKVTQIAPGLVETEFSLVRFKGDRERAKKVYEGYQPLTAQDIAQTIWFVVSAPTHVQIADLVIFPTAQASATIVKRN